jgi:hypothetical protein
MVNFLQTAASERRGASARASRRRRLHARSEATRLGATADLRDSWRIPGADRHWWSAIEGAYKDV